jgi:hypothetical protein
MLSLVLKNAVLIVLVILILHMLLKSVVADRAAAAAAATVGKAGPPALVPAPAQPAQLAAESAGPATLETYLSGLSKGTLRGDPAAASSSLAAAAPAIAEPADAPSSLFQFVYGGLGASSGLAPLASGAAAMASDQVVGAPAAPMVEPLLAAAAQQDPAPHNAAAVTHPSDPLFHGLSAYDAKDALYQTL